MSAEIVNLRQARKEKSRTERAEKAAENRAKFGRPRAEREATDRLQDLQDRRLDGHRLPEDDAAG